jgi:uncharacterized protein YdhG (YjbR/CyaY superfamily)
MPWPDVKAVPDGEPAKTEIDQYIAGLPPEKRAATEHLRASIARFAPDAVPAISYSMPAFRYRKRALASFAAAAKFLGLYPMSGQVIETLGPRLEAYTAGKGSLRIPYDQPMPDDLLEAIIHARKAEIDGSAAAAPSGTPPASS